MAVASLSSNLLDADNWFASYFVVVGWILAVLALELANSDADVCAYSYLLITTADLWKRGAIIKVIRNTEEVV